MCGRRAPAPQTVAAATGKGVMSVYVTTTERGRAWALVLAALLVLALFVAMLALLPLAALVLLAGTAVSGAALLFQRATAARPSARPARPVPDAPAGPLLVVVDADGEAVSARAVSVAGQSEHTLALTRDGYVLLDADGRVIHAL